MSNEETEYTREHKIPKYDIRLFMNTDALFYDKVGPFLSRREIVAELGGTVWDDDDKVWCVAMTPKHEVLGVAATRGQWICSLYVTPGARGKFIGYALLLRALDQIHTNPVHATVTEASHGLFQMAGFVDIGVKGSFYRMTLGGADV